MVPPRPRFGSLTILGAIVTLIGFAGALLILAGDHNNNAEAFVTATIGPAIVVLLSLFQAQQNSHKADVAAAKATETAVIANQSAGKLDDIHKLVNGNLTELRRIIAQAILEDPEISSPISGKPTTPPPSEANQ